MGRISNETRLIERLFTVKVAHKRELLEEEECDDYNRGFVSGLEYAKTTLLSILTDLEAK